MFWKYAANLHENTHGEVQFNHPEAVVRMCSLKKLLLKTSQNSHENGLWHTDVFLRIFCEIFKSTCYRAPPVAASVDDLQRFSIFFNWLSLMFSMQARSRGFGEMHYNSLSTRTAVTKLGQLEELETPISFISDHCKKSLLILSGFHCTKNEVFH